jgi:curli biogenesis system outer membrane secretion channel CsgG
MKSRKYFSLILSLITVSCATVGQHQRKVTVTGDSSAKVQIENNSTPNGVSQKKYKRKLAILRFSNETNYGRALLSSADYDRIGKQTSDMLASRLIESNEFLVFERTDLEKLKLERSTSKEKSELIGVDTVIAGSLTEFGRAIDGQSGFLSNTKKQTAHAKVEIRLIDIGTGQAFFSTKGVGEASTESGEVAGFGSRSEYDSTLNDRAIGAAISDMISSMVNKLRERPWRTDILDVQGPTVFISGGKSQGLSEGDVLWIVKPGKQIKSAQSGFTISLPPKQVAQVKIISLFGDNETNEGAVSEVMGIPSERIDIKTMHVVEGKK